MAQQDELFEMFDEFGNFIGGDPAPADDQESEDRFRGQDEDQNIQETPFYGAPGQERLPEDAIVLYEDKKYYPELEEMYPGAEALIEEEDGQAITDPLIKTKKEKGFDLKIPVPNLLYSTQFLTDMMKNPETIRNIAIVGSLHHGKTRLVDLLVENTHLDKMPECFTDARKDEQDRLISVKATPMTFVLSNSKEKSYLINLMDTPGHPNFIDEVCCSLRLADGAVLVVDAIEGCMLQTEKLLRYIVHEQIPLCVVINKVDRLILELKIPPEDAYLKLKHTIEELNGVLRDESVHLPWRNQVDYQVNQ
jgi:116 kDa U5 small nuclear ribonucleoprotein component